MDFRDLAKVPHKHFYSKHLVISGAGLAYGFARIRSVPFIARYPIRDSRVFDAIAKALKYDTRDYARVVVSRIREDGALAQKLKERIGPLSMELEA